MQLPSLKATKTRKTNLKSGKIFKKIITMLPFIIFVGIAILLGTGLRLKPSELPSALLNRSAPSFQVTTLETPTKMVDESIFKDHITLFNVWASWCYSCKKEHPFLNQLAQRDLAFFKKQNIRIIGLNVQDEFKTAADWLKAEGNPMPSPLNDPNGSVAIDFGIYGTPETFIIDKEGIIRFRHVGPLDEKIWQAQFKPLIEQLK